MKPLNEVAILLDESPAYRHALDYWHPLLVQGRNGTDDDAGVFADFVRITLLPAMRREEQGRRILQSLSIQDRGADALVACLAEALRDRHVSLSRARRSRFGKLRSMLSSPLVLTAMIALMLVAAVHLHASTLGIREELKVLYLAPLMNIVVIFFVAPAIYQVLKRLLK